MEDDREKLIHEYFREGFKYPQITEILYQQHQIILSLRQLKRILRKLKLKRRCYSDIREAVEFIRIELQSSGQLHGYRIMHERCRLRGINVRMNDVRIILKQLDPVGVAHRTARRFRRRAYFADGPNFIWHIDGYDKLKPYGLCISGCICGFSRKIIWLKVYNTNNNPRIIGGYFLEAVSEIGGCPRFVRGDYGTENGHVCAFQSFLREDGEPGNTHSRQQSFIYGTSTTNQRIESWWGYLRREHIQFWMELFKSLQDRGEFSGDSLDKNLVLFCFLPLIQDELDNAAKIWDNHRIRHNRNQEAPNGRPRQMFHFPVLWNKMNKLCEVKSERFNFCVEEAEFRSTIPCDPDLYQICINIMASSNLTPAKDPEEGVALYLYLRDQILNIISG